MVVVIPLMALRVDLQQRCQRLGIICVEWESQWPPDEASIVLVTPESAVTGDFFKFLNQQQLVQQLDQIVIDECHVMLNDWADFWPKLQQLGKLLEAETQMVLLTVTLPPVDEALLCSQLHCLVDQVRIFWSWMSQANMAY